MLTLTALRLLAYGSFNMAIDTTLRNLEGLSAEALKRIPSLIISADSHLEEPSTLWDKLPSAIRERIPVRRGGTFKRPPGSASFDPKLRLVDMDQDGVAAEVLYPDRMLNFFALDREVQEAAFRAYNDWLAEFCSANPKRLYGIAALSVYDIDWAIREMQRTYELGMRAAMVWEVPDPKLPFTSPHYDKLWAAAAELGQPINLHVLTGHNYFRFEAHGIERARNAANHKTADTMNSLFDLIWSGVFERHPKLKVGIIESEVGWVPFALQQWDHYHHRYSQPGRQHEDFPIKRRPSEIFHEHIHMTFMDDTVGSKTIPWWGERICMWSSDYPHSNSTWPHSRAFVARQVGELSPSLQKRLVSQNVIETYRLNV
jgi:predicted TIM-barrel fold metal-dependent hydrolase